MPKKIQKQVMCPYDNCSSRPFSVLLTFIGQRQLGGICPTCRGIVFYSEKYGFTYTDHLDYNEKFKESLSKCLNCGQMKHVHGSGLCSACFAYKLRTGNNRPVASRICACGCNQPIPSCKPNQIYLNRKHKDRAFGKRIHSKYLGIVLCPICQQYGSLIARYYSNAIRSFQIVHYKSQKYVKSCTWNPY
jgi:ribosomal protein L32